MDSVNCPQCGNEVHFHDLQYGRGEEHYTGFRCPHCGGVGIRISVYKEEPIPCFVYPFFTPFNMASRVQFVTGECRREQFSFISKSGVRQLDRDLVAQLNALEDESDEPDEPIMVGYFH
jgi:DNA-directed RNA polymerase subunit RPC12/RpoP